MSPTPLLSDFRSVTLPDMDWPRGMISDSERRFLYDLTRNQYTATGAIVELGTWLGCSTTHLAAGLRDAGHSTKLNSFDDYIWRPGMGKKSGIDLPDGDSFFPYFLENTKPVSDYINPKIASATNLQWSGGDIEILVVDAPKSWRSIRRLIKQLAPHFITGKTHIAFQDYLHFPSYEIALCAAALGALSAEVVVLDGVTVMFRVVDEIDPAKLADDYLYTRFPAEEINRLWAEILAPLPDGVRDTMAPAHAMTLWQLGYKEEAEARIAEISVSQDAANFIMRKTKAKEQDHFRWVFEQMKSRIQKKA